MPGVTESLPLNLVGHRPRNRSVAGHFVIVTVGLTVMASCRFEPKYGAYEFRYSDGASYDNRPLQTERGDGSTWDWYIEPGESLDVFELVGYDSTTPCRIVDRDFRCEISEGDLLGGTFIDEGRAAVVRTYVAGCHECPDELDPYSYMVHEHRYWIALDAADG